MRSARKNEKRGHWFRSSRLFTVDGFWYFSTREGVDIGPYETRRDAQIEVGFLRELLVGSHTANHDKTVHSFVRDAHALGRF